MQLVDSLAYLSDDTCYFLLRHTLVSFELLEELPAHGYFHDQVDIHSVIEETVHADNIRVV